MDLLLEDVEIKESSIRLSRSATSPVLILGTKQVVNAPATFWAAILNDLVLLRWNLLSPDSVDLAV